MPSPHDLVTADPDWRSDDPFLSGNFAPVGRELDVADLEVVAGAIPEDLSGSYLRNGPNPQFEPLSFTYPFDGDGMIHAVSFAGGKARYRNRFVVTRGLIAERRAGRALYGGLMHPVPVDAALVGADGEPGPYKNGAFINVMRHGDHLLALSETSPAYAMTPELETIGEWTAGTGRPLSLGAHNRRHPVTGDLFAIEYKVRTPTVAVHRIDPAGRLAHSFDVELAAPSMIHDFVLTERHVVLLIGPAVFDLAAAARGEPFIAWRPELGTRIAVAPLDGGTAPTWYEAEPFFVFHFANGFERGAEIVVDYVRHERLNLGSGRSGAPPRLHRLVLDPASRRVRDAALADVPVEFPRVNDRLEARPTRYVYVPTLSAALAGMKRGPAVFNVIVKVDTETGTATQHDLGDRSGGEPVFIPRPGATGEDDGYLAVYAYDPKEKTSDLVLLDAVDPSRDPVGVIRMPQRVPQGLHGNWMPR